MTKGTIVTSIMSGTVSKISGGKFSNGAVTGAFVHMFNHSMQTNNSLQQFALYGKYRDVREDTFFTANRIDTMASKNAWLGFGLAARGEFLLSGVAYASAGFFTIMKHISLISIGETDWASFSRDIATKTGKSSNVADHLSNEMMKRVD